jgi:hypothetical protein
MGPGARPSSRGVLRSSDAPLPSTRTRIRTRTHAAHTLIPPSLPRTDTDTARTHARSISVTFIDKDGSEINVFAPIGTNLLEVAHDNEIDLEGGCARVHVCVCVV